MACWGPIDRTLVRRFAKLLPVVQPHPGNLGARTTHGVTGTVFHNIDLDTAVRDPCFAQLHSVADQRCGAVNDARSAIGEYRDVIARAAAAGGAPEECDRLPLAITVQNNEWFQCPPPLLRTAVLISAGRLFKPLNNSSNDLFCKFECDSKAPFNLLT